MYMGNELTKEELERAEALQKDENKWVALVDDKVVAAGETMKETTENAEKAGYKDITFRSYRGMDEVYKIRGIQMNKPRGGRGRDR